MNYELFEKQIKEKIGFLPITLKRLTFTKEKNVIVAHDPMNKQVNGEWIVNPIAITDVHVYVVCPFCGKIHRHGIADGNYSGNRVTHCEYSGNYYVNPITG